MGWSERTRDDAESAARRPVTLRRWAVLATVLALGVLTTAWAAPAADAAAAPGPGTIDVTPASASGSSTGLTLDLRYTAPASGLEGGVVTVSVPRGWSAPQHRRSTRQGYVTASAGTVRVVGRTVRVSALDLCGGCSLTITYADARSPAGGRSTFTTRTSSSSSSRRRALSAQPSVTLTPAYGTSSGPAPLGDYAGYADPDGLALFSAATGASLSYALDYLPKTSGWSGMDGAKGMGAWAGTGYQLVLGVPIIPTDSSGAAQGTLAEGATGAYDGYFTTLASNLVREGLSDAILRLGWEFNGDWFAWSVQSGTDAADFAAYWRQIVTTMRAVSGEHFRFMWNPNALSPTSYDPSEAYPGDAYVDYVGIDAYDEFWGSPFTPQAAWHNLLGEQYGLDWLASFAAAHGKAMAIAEWSCAIRSDGYGLGDDPYYVSQMAAWIAANHPAFTDIFSFDGSSSQLDDLLDGNFPNALAQFETDFG